MKARIGLAATFLLALVGHAPAPAAADHGNAAEVFERTWQRTDLPVVSALATRTWIWGPEPFTEIIHEQYAEADTGERSVQYYDKARMEATYTDADQDAVWYVTNGLLVIELMSGRLQLGDNTFQELSPAEVNIAGDAVDPLGPTYRSIAEVSDEPAAAVGEVITQRLARSGSISNDAALGDQGIQVATVTQETSHAIAQPFWDFMNSSGTVYVDDEFTTDLLFQNPYFATGFPVSEPYWADVRVGGETMLVLLQCFERRCLTYTPGNAPGWQVEAGNVGLHYHAWRYSDDVPEPDPVPVDCEYGSGPAYAGQDLVQPVFISQNLMCADFSGASVSQGNFSEANAYKADFTGAELGQPVFRNTLLDAALFISVDAAQPHFEGASAVGADFSNATLSQPVFVSTSLLSADLTSAVMVMPQFLNTVCPDSTNSDDNGGTCMGHLEPVPPPTP